MQTHVRVRVGASGGVVLPHDMVIGGVPGPVICITCGLGAWGSTTSTRLQRITVSSKAAGRASPNTYL
jgi:hypothetical protein